MFLCAIGHVLLPRSSVLIVRTYIVPGTYRQPWKADQTRIVPSLLEYLPRLRGKHVQPVTRTADAAAIIPTDPAGAGTDMSHLSHPISQASGGQEGLMSARLPAA